MSGVDELVKVLEDVRALIDSVLALEDRADLGTCPYYLKNGGMGEHGPNTCTFGCSSEPECQTCEPVEGWPYAIATRLAAIPHPLTDQTQGQGVVGANAVERPEPAEEPW